MCVCGGGEGMLSGCSCVWRCVHACGCVRRGVHVCDFVWRGVHTCECVCGGVYNYACGCVWMGVHACGWVWRVYMLVRGVCVGVGGGEGLGPVMLSVTHTTLHPHAWCSDRLCCCRWSCPRCLLTSSWMTFTKRPWPWCTTLKKSLPVPSTRYLPWKSRHSRPRSRDHSARCSLSLLKGQPSFPRVDFIAEHMGMGVCVCVCVSRCLCVCECVWVCVWVGVCVCVCECGCVVCVRASGCRCKCVCGCVEWVWMRTCA